jgi:hypothetical protein
MKLDAEQTHIAVRNKVLIQRVAVDRPGIESETTRVG